MNIIFVVGTPRSGTTFLQSCLLGLEGYTSIPETHYFSTLFAGRGLFSWRSKLRAASCLRHAFQLRCLPKLTLRAASKDFARSAHRYLERAGYSGLIEKTPMHLWYRDQIAQAIPEAQFVHIVRGRYEVVRSMYKATNKYPDAWGGRRSVSQCDIRWQRDIQLHRQHIGADNSIFVSYEDLCVHPKEILRIIAMKIGAEVSPRAENDRVNNIISSDERWKIEDLESRRHGSFRYADFISESKFSADFRLDRNIEESYRDILKCTIK